MKNHELAGNQKNIHEAQSLLFRKFFKCLLSRV